MRYSPSIIVSLLVLLAGCTGQDALRPEPARVARSAGAPDPRVADSYIVVLKPGADPRGTAAAVGASPRFVYGAALNGFAARLNGAQVEALRHNPHVAFIEQDKIVTASTTQTSAPWGLDRIDQRALPTNTQYSYTATAGTVHVYVLDTGIHAPHAEFEGRATNDFDAVGGAGSGTDCNGHGTHVAGIVGARTWGVAKKVKLHGVRVLGCDGTGTITATIAGVDWVAKNAIAPAVANMSLGSPADTALDSAVNRLADLRVFVAAAAGNNDVDACTVSPARAPTAYAVAAIRSADTRWGYSNWGPCVDIYAPGTEITSTSNNGGTQVRGGTSMAAAHVAGVAALYKATYGNATTGTIHNWLRQNATVNAVVNGSQFGTPNYLLFKSTL